MAYDNNNVFAQILRDESPVIKVYENDHTLAFMDIMPQVDGHTLVIPKAPATDLHDLDPEALAETIMTTQRVAGAVKRAFDAPGIMLAQLSGVAAGQTVFHLHFHILPRFHGIEFKLHAREVEAWDKLEAFATRIRAALPDETS